MRTTARLAVAVAGTTAALLVGGAGTAFADDPETTQGPITLTPSKPPTSAPRGSPRSWTGSTG
ncbi:MAG: hypothetical protein K0R87_615 [Pseudonocardia sp.]|jgi:hypothetical protein|nr:hypothetical protein [Pseudonocardia sp.]